MEKIVNFTDLNAWKFGHELVLSIYKVTKLFPKYEIFGLTNQMQRSAVSVTSNIAEGFSRRYAKEKVQFYFVSLGSLTELQNQTIIARDIGYINEVTFKDIELKYTTVQKLICGLIKSIREN